MPLVEISTAHALRRVPILAGITGALALKRNLDKVTALNDREAGATLFIIGAGPQLNDLSPDHIRVLRDRPTIGVNRTQYVVDLKYFISAYPSEVLLARKRCNERTTIINIRPKLEPPIVRKTLTIRRVHHLKGQDLDPSFSPPEPTLHTFKNVALAATHFALVLGAKRVVFVGVEQTNALHFYDVRPAIRRLIARDIQRIRAKQLFTVDHPSAIAAHLVERLSVPPNELAGRDFYFESHKDRFRDFFSSLSRQGTEVFATTPDSVVAEAGAEVVALEEALEW